MITGRAKKLFGMVRHCYCWECCHWGVFFPSIVLKWQQPLSQFCYFLSYPLSASRSQIWSSGDFDIQRRHQPSNSAFHLSKSPCRAYIGETKCVLIWFSLQNQDQLRTVLPSSMKHHRWERTWNNITTVACLVSNMRLRLSRVPLVEHSFMHFSIFWVFGTNVVFSCIFYE